MPESSISISFACSRQSFLLTQVQAPPLLPRTPGSLLEQEGPAGHRLLLRLEPKHTPSTVYMLTAGNQGSGGEVTCSRSHQGPGTWDQLSRAPLTLSQKSLGRRGCGAKNTGGFEDPGSQVPAGKGWGSWPPTRPPPTPLKISHLCQVPRVLQMLRAPCLSVPWGPNPPCLPACTQPTAPPCTQGQNGCEPLHYSFILPSCLARGHWAS